MPRTISIQEKSNAVDMLLASDRSGKWLFGQREIERETSLSRQYIRKLAAEVGREFERNGIEIVGQMCMCTNCGCFFRRPKSKVERARRNFCDDLCRETFLVGTNHPNWKDGKSVSSFSKWVSNKAEYQRWRKLVLERDNNRCIISGKTDNLNVHHVKLKSLNPEAALDINNGITLCEEVHEEIHHLIREGLDFEECLSKLKEKYANG